MKSEMSDAAIAERMKEIARAIDNNQYADETARDHKIIQAVLLGLLIGVLVIYAICI